MPIQATRVNQTIPNIIHGTSLPPRGGQRSEVARNVSFLMQLYLSTTTRLCMDFGIVWLTRVPGWACVSSFWQRLHTL